MMLASKLNAYCFIALMGGMLLTAAVFADDAVPDTSSDTDTPSLSQQMIESLVSQGWSQSTGDDGSIFVLPPQIEQPIRPSIAETLREQLEKTGWIAITAEDGSTVYGRPEAPAAIESAEATGQEPSQSPAEQLGQQLAAHGWESARAEDGSVIYRPPMPPSAASNRTLADQVRNALVQQGWVATVAPDGSQIYRTPVQPDEPTDPIDAAATPDAVNTGVSETASVGEQLGRQLEAHGWVASPEADGSVVYHRSAQVPPAASVPPLAERMRQALQRQGWTATTEDDGSVVYRSPGLTTEPATAPISPPPQDAMAQQLRQRLEAKGWTAAPAPNGGIYLLPPEIAAGSSTPAAMSTQSPATAEGPGDPQSLEEVQPATQAGTPEPPAVLPAEPEQVRAAAPVPQPTPETPAAAVSQLPAVPIVPVPPKEEKASSPEMPADETTAAQAVAAPHTPPASIGPSIAPDRSDAKTPSVTEVAVEKPSVTERSDAPAGHSTADPAGNPGVSAALEPRPVAPAQTAESTPYDSRQSPAHRSLQALPPASARPYRQMPQYPQSVYRVPPSWYVPPPAGSPDNR